MSALHVSVIVTQDAKIISVTHVSDDTDFETKEEADAYKAELDEWIEARPKPHAGVELPKPTQVDEVEVQQVFDDIASAQAAELARIIHPRDAWLGIPDNDPEEIASKVEHRPYDQEHV